MQITQIGNKLEILQIKAIRKVYKAKYNESSTPLFRYLHIPNIADMFNIYKCKFMVLYTNGMFVESLQAIFKIKSNIHSHNTRRCRDSHVVTRQTSLYNRLPKCSFIVHPKFGLI